jgi:phage terminase large subunit-like protein
MECDPKTGRRIIREIVISMGRKNAKSTTGCGLAACWLFGPEAEPRGQVAAVAVDKDEARNLFDEIVAMVEADDRLGAFVDIKHHLGQIKVIHGQGTGSTFKTMSADDAKAHGKNLTFVLGDECGLWKGMGLYDGLVTGSGVRKEPLFVFMSTRQRKEDTPLRYLLERAKRQAAGELKDPSFHAVVYSVPDDAEDIFDETIWPLANPALEGTCEGGFLGWEEMRKEANLARQFPSREQVFRLLHLNQEIGSAASLISRTDWLACQDDGISLDALRGRPCWVGLDLSSTTDLTAMVLYFPEDGGAVFPFFWMAQQQVAIRTREDNVPYEQYVREGILETTPGRAISQRVIARRLQQILGLYDVRAVPYDRARSEDLMTILSEEGIAIPVVPFGQGWVSMSPAIDAFERAVLNKEMRHNGDPLLTRCISNAAAEIVDTYGNRKLVKVATRARIDGAIALVMAIGQWAKRSPDDDSATPFRGMTSGLINRSIQADRRMPERRATAA